MAKNAFLCLLSMLLLATAGTLYAQPAFDAVKAESPPRIDGDLSDECWGMATKVSDFWHLESGLQATEPTTAWMCYDDKNIYVAFDARDSRPDAIHVQQTKRDGNLLSDDHVKVYFDPFSEHRSDALSSFTVSAGGVQAHRFHSSVSANTGWAGDWDAAARRDRGGYRVEMRIPWSILKYDRSNPRITVAFQRKHIRLAQDWYAPDAGKTLDLSRWYIWQGVRPPLVRPRPVVLLYSLLGMGKDDSPKRLGADAKYAITPSLTGLMTINPDFRNVEQQVESIDFTYTEQYIPDSRPFFQESAQYFPGSPVYYTRRIGELDAGVKVVGLVNDYQVGFSNVRRFGQESYTVAEATKQFGNRKDFSVWAGGVLSEVEGADSLAAFTTLDYRWRHSEDRSTDFHYTLINSDNGMGSGHGGMHSLTAQTNAGPQKLNLRLRRQAIDSDFHPYLGLQMDTGVKSWGLEMSVWDSPQHGAISYKNLSLWLEKVDRLDGSRFSTSIIPSFALDWRNGAYCRLSYRDQNRLAFHDHIYQLSYGWNSKDLYRGGGIACSFGDQADGDYAYVSLSQGLRLTDNLSARIWTEYSKIGDTSPYAGIRRQTIVTAAYDISPERSVVARWIRRQGKSNMYLAFRQKVRAGLDAYLILGDPNAEETEDSILLKLVRPL